MKISSREVEGGEREGGHLPPPDNVVKGCRKVWEHLKSQRIKGARKR